jgi:hypothetical protein
VRKETGKRSAPADQAGRVEHDRLQGCLLRLFWMAFGNMALLALTLLIFERHGFSLLDLAYWGIVVALGSARYADIARFQGLTTSGEPATTQHLRRYLLGLFLATAGLWLLVHALGFL